MKTYRFELIVSEGNDEEWERINDQGLSGCNEVLEMVREMLRDNPQLDAAVRLVEFTDIKGNRYE